MRVFLDLPFVDQLYLCLVLWSTFAMALFTVTYTIYRPWRNTIGRIVYALSVSMLTVLAETLIENFNYLYGWNWPLTWVSISVFGVLTCLITGCAVALMLRLRRDWKRGN